MQNWPFNFHIFSFQSSNFQFCQFSSLTFNFCQFKAPLLRLLLLPLNPLNDAVLHVVFFYNLELKEKSEKKKKEKKKKKTLRGSFPFPNSFHNLFESHRQILTKLNFKSLGEREQRRNKNKSSFSLLLIWYLFLSHLPSSITFSFSLPLSVPNSH